MSHTSLGKAQHARRAGPRSAGSPLEPRTPDALAPLIQSQSARPVAPAAGQLAAGLAVVHVAWGATYRAPRVLVETIPPWLSAGARFLLAGTLLLGILGRFLDQAWVR